MYHELSELGHSGPVLHNWSPKERRNMWREEGRREGGGISDCSRGQSPRSSTQSPTIFCWSRTQFVHKQHVCNCSSFVLSHTDWPSHSNVCDSFSQRRTQGYFLVCDNPIKVVLTTSPNGKLHVNGNMYIHPILEFSMFLSFSFIASSKLSNLFTPW